MDDVWKCVSDVPSLGRPSFEEKSGKGSSDKSSGWKDDPVAPKRGIVACASCESSRQLQFSSCSVLSAVILADSCLWSSHFDAG